MIKKILQITTIFILSIILISCENGSSEDLGALETALNNLEVPTEVSSNFTLPTKVGEFTLTWDVQGDGISKGVVNNTTNTISMLVTQDLTDQQAILTVTISFGSLNKNKNFNVFVLAAENSYTVTFDGQGGSNIPANTNVFEGNKLTEPPAPTRSGYNFAGWLLNNVLFDFNTEITADITLVAKWDAKNVEVPRTVLDSGMFTSRDNIPSGWQGISLGTDYVSANARLKFDTSNAKLYSPSFVLHRPAEVKLTYSNNTIKDSKLHIKNQNNELLHTFTDFTTSHLTFTILDITTTQIRIEYEKTSGNLGLGRVVITHLDSGDPVFDLHDKAYYAIIDSNWTPPVINATNFDGTPSTVTNNFNPNTLNTLGTYQVEYTATDSGNGLTTAIITYYVIEYEGQLDDYPNMNELDLLGTYNSFNNHRQNLDKKEDILDFDIEDYYATLDGLTEEAFFNELYNIINVTQTSYGEARFITEQSDAIDTVWGTYLHGVYDNFKIERYWNGAAGYEREHVWPNSYLGKGDHPGNEVKNIQTDAHNIRAILGTTNTSRGNRYFNYPIAGGNNHLVGTTAYYPGEDHRGDIARILMYMHVRYNDVLVLTDNKTAIENYSAGNHSNTLLDGKIPFGLLGVLIEWHYADPVDDFELYRNNVIYEYQGNRNPFIDHMDYVGMIFFDHEYFNVVGVAFEQNEVIILFNAGSLRYKKEEMYF